MSKRKGERDPKDKHFGYNADDVDGLIFSEYIPKNKREAREAERVRASIATALERAEATKND